ncbi:hypothetical protein GCM10010468_71680 [Actinocorallia longicatena]|uniref:Uncharacterized protein n=2 Tax=Actinocorallia longicatena TaxID=111803 RepID=A0ABP6QKR4_9ACTN
MSSDDPAKVRIEFEFFNAGDGAIFEVVHQGVTCPTLSGAIVGAELPTPIHADLSQSRLRSLAESIRSRRIANVKYLASSSTVGLLAAMAIPAVAVTLVLNNGWPDRTPKLVDVHKYDLNSLRGQEHFAKKVYDVGTSELNWVGPALFILIILAYSAMALYIAREQIDSWKKKVPPTVLAVLLEEEDGDDPGEG